MRLTLFLCAVCAFLMTAGCTGLASGTVTSDASNTPATAPIEALEMADAVVAELNAARTDPRGYARMLEEQLPEYRGTEGSRALRDAIADLESMEPRKPLQMHSALTAAARDHVDDQSASGATGHVGTDGSQPWDRIRLHMPTAGAAENIAYGIWDARTIVMELIIDDGVPGRGHRRNIFEASYALVGVAVGPHPTYGIMSVIDFSLRTSGARGHGR